MSRNRFQRRAVVPVVPRPGVGCTRRAYRGCGQPSDLDRSSGASRRNRRRSCRHPQALYPDEHRGATVAFGRGKRFWCFATGSGVCWNRFRRPNSPFRWRLLSCSLPSRPTPSPVFMLTAFINADPKDRPFAAPGEGRRAADGRYSCAVLQRTDGHAERDPLPRPKHIHYPREKLRVVLLATIGGNGSAFATIPTRRSPRRPRPGEAGVCKKLCRELGVLYSTRRPQTNMQRPGNMSAALSRLDGDLGGGFRCRPRAQPRFPRAHSRLLSFENPRLFPRSDATFLPELRPRWNAILGLAPSCPAEKRDVLFRHPTAASIAGRALFFCGARPRSCGATALNEAGGFLGRDDHRRCRDRARYPREGLGEAYTSIAP